MLTTQESYVRVQNLGTTVDAADAYLHDHRWENAVTAYQDFGSQGAAFGNDLNPNDPSILQTATLNVQLQSLVSHLASQATANQASSLAHQMLTLYQAAYNVSPNVPTPSGPVVVAPTATPSSTKTVATVALWGFVAVGLGVMGYMLWKAPPMSRVFDNPSRGSGGDGKKTRRKSRPIVKGRSCRFEMVDGPAVSCVGGMIHDPSGKGWPSRSVLCGPFKARVRRASPDEYTGAAKHYLGTSHQPSIGIVDTPPKSLSEWEYLGDVDRIFYTRTGQRRPGRYQHPINKASALAVIIKGKGRVRLYRRGRFCRIELPPGAILDTRGFVWP